MLIYVAMLEKTIFNITFRPKYATVFCKKKLRYLTVLCRLTQKRKFVNRSVFYLHVKRGRVYEKYLLELNFCGLYLNFEMHCFISSMSVCGGCFIATRKLCAVLLVTPEPDIH